MRQQAGDKYDAFPAVRLPSRKWPERRLTGPPRWLSTDLRDGNQALAQPMDGNAKLRYFKALLDLGYKEIEVSYPSASQTEFDFTRHLITTPGLVPDDVTLQVMAPCREDLIRTTIDAARGAKQAILHIHLSTSDIFRKVVFNTTEQDLIDLAVRCIKLIRELTKDSYDPEIRKTKWTLEFTPENFQDTTLDYALRICEAVKAAWQPSRDDQIIFNLTATVEVAMPNVFADQIEYFCDHITDREKVCVSVHNHNDRGSAVATAEMAQLAGAERVEGCLFGNGERTGNVDLVILAMNLYTQGIDPGIDFGNINDVVKMVEDLTKIPVHLRAPYAGRYTFCTFSGSHQDAIRKGYKARAAQEKALQYSPKWAMPYLPMDPVDVGREHEAVIRLNSQSGKGGIGWYVKEVFGMEMPRELEIAFTKIVKTYATATGLEMTHGMIEKLFRSQYMLPEDASLQILDCKVSESGGSNNRVKLHSRIAIDGAAYNIRGSGSDPVASALDGAAQMGLVTKPIHHQVQQVATDQDEPGPIQTATFVKLHTDAKETSWGVSIHENATWSSLQAVLSALSRMEIAIAKDGRLSPPRWDQTVSDATGGTVEMGS